MADKNLHENFIGILTIGSQFYLYDKDGRRWEPEAHSTADELETVLMQLARSC
jgi:hypothetical protein